MTLFKTRPLNRHDLLAMGAEALGKGHRKKALRLYGQALREAPGDVELHSRMAPLLAAAGRREEAWDSYRRVARHHREAGFLDRAVAAYHHAAERLPRTAEVWEELSAVEIERNRPEEARRVLEEGIRHTAWRGWRERLRLTRCLHSLDPSDVEVSGRLARLLVRSGERRLALEVLSEMEPAADRTVLRQLRALAMWLSPTPTTGWRWLRAVVVGR